MTNQEVFERIAARVLASAKEAFPVAIILRPTQLLAAEDIEWNKVSSGQCAATLKWLRDEGFFRSQDGILGQTPDGFAIMYQDAVLTAKGLEALNVKVKIGDREGTAGDLLVEQVKEGGKDVRSAAIHELIGGIVGAAVRNFLGAG